MLDANGKRMLAYVQEIVDVEPLYFCKTVEKEDGTKEFVPDLNEKGEKTYADAIEKIHVLGWSLICKKGEFKPGDKCVFFEIDSKVPSGKFLDAEGKDVFEFLASKHYNVKTYKLNKFGAWSMGLALPLSAFGIDPETPLNTDLTETLGITYSIKEDNFRKSDRREMQIRSFKAKHKKFFNNRLVRYLMRFRFFRWLFLLPMNKGKKDMKKAFPSEFVSKTDEERCLTADTKITTNIGVIRIADIVNKKLPVLVKSYNETTGDIEYKEILDYQKFDKNNNLLEIKVPYNFTSTKRCRTIVCTKDHKFLVNRFIPQTGEYKDVYVKAQELEKNDTVYMLTNTYSDPEIIEFLYGNILGDGHIYLENNKVRFSFGQGEKHKEYVDLLYRMYNASYYVSEPNGFNRSKTNHKFGLINTDLLSYFVHKDNIFQKSSKKWMLTPEFCNRLTWKSLALWYLDDGSFVESKLKENNESSCSIFLHTEGYSIEENQLLIETLKNNFGLEATIQGLKNKYQYIRLKKESSRKFIENIYKYVPKCLEYKIPKDLRGTYTCELGNKIFSFKEQLLPVSIVSVRSFGKVRTTYDLEIADNHNFFAGGILTHNCQNMPWILEDKTPLIATEKIDGTSTTWLMVRKGANRFEFYVCSRNVRMFKPDQECYMGNDNIYWENAIKYDVEKQLKDYLKKHKELKWVCIQGESYGEGWQGNPLKMKGHHFAAFNFKDSEHGRWGSIEAKNELASWETPIPWVPILNTDFVLPDTVEELLNIATAKSVVNPDVLREGIVFRGKDGQLSFKAVSPEYLMKHNA